MTKLTFVSQLEDTAEYEALLREYYVNVLRVAEKAGLPKLSATDLAAESIDHIDEALPPEGRLLLANADDGTLIGCGMLRRIRPDAVELKRVFVRPEAQGQKLGVKILRTLLSEAESMGCSGLYADTVKGNDAMTRICEYLGFEYIDRYAENANPVAYAPFLVFMRYSFT